MSTRIVSPPWEYLRNASQPSLQSFELSRLNHAADIRKEIDALLDQWLEETAAALLARFLLDHPVAPNATARGRTRAALNAAARAAPSRFLARGRAG
jgi:hypothetical protein